MDPSDEAEELMSGVGKRCLRGNGPATPGELPHPIRIEIATTCVYACTVIRMNVGVSITDMIFWGTTNGDRVVICGVCPGMCARRKMHCGRQIWLKPIVTS
jgi:hypothetical protein